MMFLEFKKTNRVIATALLVTLLVTLFAPLTCVSASAVTTNSATPAVVSDPNVVEITEGANTYPLFNSGRTNSDGYSTYSRRINPDCDTFDNDGYDLEGNLPEDGRIRIGQSFVINTTITEQASLNILAWDVDENSGHCPNRGDEHDYIYLIDETNNTSEMLDGMMSGQTDTWNNSIFRIDPSLFTTGHKYHFELQMNCTCSNANCTYYAIVVRTVSLTTSGQNIDGDIEEANLTASISSNRLVSVNLTAKSYSNKNYTLEYKVVCSADNVQYGGTEQSVYITTSLNTFNTSFYLDSFSAPRGTYEITVFIKDDNNNVVETRTVTASYGYSAVSYNSNGGSQNLPTDGTTYASGDTVTVKFNYVPSKYGYNFLGWSTDPNATVPQYTENGNKTFTIGSSDVVLYAVWAEDIHYHTESDWIIDVPAGCTTPGSKHTECIECGEIMRTEIIEPLGHDYILEEIVEPRCTVDGYVLAICSLCGDERYEIIPAPGHVESDWIIISNPTSTTAGIKRIVCMVCGETLVEEPIPVLALIDIEDVETKVGAIVNVTIDIQNNPGVLGAILTLTYDPALTLIDANAGSAWSSLNLTKPGRYNNYCNFVWDGMNDADSSNGTIITLTFEVSDTAHVGDVYIIGLSYTDGNIVDENNEPIKVEISEGSITVTQLKGDVNDDGVVDVADVVCLRRYIAGGYDVTINELQSDMNEDGVINISDIIELRRYIVNG